MTSSEQTNNNIVDDQSYDFRVCANCHFHHELRDARNNVVISHCSAPGSHTLTPDKQHCYYGVTPNGRTVWYKMVDPLDFCDSWHHATL